MHESSLTGFQAGSVVIGQILQQNNGSWTVLSIWPGSQNRFTSLTVADAGRTFDWVDVTLETYRYVFYLYFKVFLL